MTAALNVRAILSPLNGRGTVCTVVLLHQEEPRSVLCRKPKSSEGPEAMVSGNWFKESTGNFQGQDKAQRDSPGSTPRPHSHTGSIGGTPWPHS